MDRIITSVIIITALVLVVGVVWGGYSLIKLLPKDDSLVVIEEDSEEVALLKKEISGLKEKNQELLAENTELRKKLQELRTIVDIELEALKAQFQETLLEKIKILRNWKILYPLILFDLMIIPIQIIQLK